MIIKIDLSKYRICPVCKRLYPVEKEYKYCSQCAGAIELCDVESHDSQ